MFLLCIAVFFIISLVLFISDMAERKFTRGLNKPGMAAQLRESVSQVVRESAVLVSVKIDSLPHIFIHFIGLFSFSVRLLCLHF